MRATERLLEFVDETARLLEVWLKEDGPTGIGGDVAAQNAVAIRQALTELRRRGDTLVRRDDLRTALEGSRPEYVTVAEGDAIEAAIDRLEIALGGKLR
jgi:hypothetical protein